MGKPLSFSYHSLNDASCFKQTATEWVVVRESMQFYYIYPLKTYGDRQHV